MHCVRACVLDSSLQCAERGPESGEEMAKRSRIDGGQKKALCTKFSEGMSAVNKSTEDMRRSAAEETGLSIQTVNVIFAS